jgi:hypothetical protein
MTHLSPISGEIDIMEARGNGPAYPAQYALHFFIYFPVSALFDRDCLFAEASTTFEDR